MGELWQVEHEACCGVLDTLQRFDYGDRKSSQERVGVVKAGEDEQLDQELCCFHREEGPDPAVVVGESKSAGSRTMPRFLTVVEGDTSMPLTVTCKST